MSITVTGVQSGGTSGKRYPNDPSIFGITGIFLSEIVADQIFNDPKDSFIRRNFRIVNQFAQIDDVGTIMVVQMIRQSDGQPLNISEASVLNILMGIPGGIFVLKTAQLLTDGLDGKLYFVTSLGDLPISGIYTFQGKVQIGSTVLFGNKEPVSVERNIASEIPGPTPDPQAKTFKYSDLVAGKLTINHYRGLNPPYTILVIIFDNNGNQIVPDAITGSANSVVVDLTSYGVFVGTWGYVYI